MSLRFILLITVINKYLAEINCFNELSKNFQRTNRISVSTNQVMVRNYLQRFLFPQVKAPSGMKLFTLSNITPMFPQIMPLKIPGTHFF